MSLVSALNIGSTALAVAQAQIQTTGNNIANAGNANYTRETTTLADNSEQQIEPGVFLGTGVDLTGVQRQVDSALTARVNSAVSDNQSANTTSQWIPMLNMDWFFSQKWDHFKAVSLQSSHCHIHHPAPPVFRVLKGHSWKRHRSASVCRPNFRYTWFLR